MYSNDRDLRPESDCRRGSEYVNKFKPGTGFSSHFASNPSLWSLLAALRLGRTNFGELRGCQLIGRRRATRLHRP